MRDTGHLHLSGRIAVNFPFFLPFHFWYIMTERTDTFDAFSICEISMILINLPYYDIGVLRVASIPCQTELYVHIYMATTSLKHMQVRYIVFAIRILAYDAT